MKSRIFMLKPIFFEILFIGLHIWHPEMKKVAVLIFVVFVVLESGSAGRILKEIPCGEVGEMKTWIAATNNETELTFRIKEIRTRGDAKQESGYTENMVIKGERLSKSKPGPAVGHMQIRP